VSISLWNDEQERPIQHLRVIDMTVMLPGPYLTRILAQYGADVIKIENLPGGDPLRQVENSSLFDLLNQGKRSVAVNLKTEAGIALVKQLAGEADVFIENFKEGVLDSMGLGYSDLSEENPDLLYMSMRGFSGKNATLAGHDLNFIAQSGVGEWFLENGSPNYSTQFGDILGGTFVPALKLMFHLANPARVGMHLITSMDENFRALYLPRAFETFKSEKSGDENINAGVHRIFDGNHPHSRYYRCRDNRWVTLNAVQPKHWDLFCEVVDRNQWKGRADDVTLNPEMEKLFSDAPATYWEALSSGKEFCLFRVIPFEEHLSFSQARPQLGTDPLNWCGFAPNASLSNCPKLGQDTFVVMHSLGVSNKDMAEWIQAGVIHQAE
jgi:alpha-methylacyl-CoA racemase